jgi:hypothetical protein
MSEDISYDPKVNLMPSAALLFERERTKHPIIAVTVLDKDELQKMQFLALMPTCPRVGEILRLQDGKFATVTHAYQAIVKRKSMAIDAENESFFTSQTYVIAKVGDKQPDIPAVDPYDLP